MLLFLKGMLALDRPNLFQQSHKLNLIATERHHANTNNEPGPADKSNFKLRWF
jgi:hypothetical protein